MNAIKRKILGAIVVIISLVLSGCSNKPNTKDGPYQYEESPIPIEASTTIFHRIDYENEQLYVTGYHFQEEHMKNGSGQGSGQNHTHETHVNAKLYTLKTDGSDLKEIPLGDWGDALIEQMVADGKGNIYLLLNLSEAETPERLLVYLSEEGEELVRIPLKDIWGESNHNEELLKLLVSETQEVLLVTKSKIYLLDAQLRVTDVIEALDSMQDAAVSKTGKLLCLMEAPQQGEMQVLTIKVWDMQKKQWEKDIQTTMGGTSERVTLLDGEEYDFYIKNGEGIIGYDEAKHAGRKLMDFMSVNILQDSADSILPLEDGSFVNVQIVDDALTKLVLFSPLSVSDATNASKKQVITYGGLFIDQQVKNAIVAFNQENNGYQIEIKEYFDEQSDITLEDAISRMHADIAAGKMPDILDMSNIAAEEYIGKGLLEDLTPYIQKDSELDESDMVPAVWEAMKTNGKMYYIAPEFSLFALVGKTEEIGNTKEFTVETLQNLLEQKGTAARLIISDLPSFTFEVLFSNSLWEYIDKENGTCNFTSNEFRQVLELCYKSNREKVESYQEEFENGNILLIPNYNLSPLDIQKYRQIFGEEEISFVGQPKVDGNGSYFTFSSRIGISTQSQVKEEAWSFVRRFLTEEYQEAQVYTSHMPLRQDCFDSILEGYTRTETYFNEAGEEANVSKGTWEWLGMCGEYQAASEKDVEQFLELVNSTKRAESYDEQLFTIVAEEAGMYFNGDRDLEKTIEVIQSRVGLYLSE